MRESSWIEWNRTWLQPPEREELLSALTSEEKAHLLDHDYVFVAGVGVLWKPAEGALRRTRFTHGTHFRPQGREFYIDSEGSARERPPLEPPASAARPPLLGYTTTTDTAVRTDRPGGAAGEQSAQTT